MKCNFLARNINDLCFRLKFLGVSTLFVNTLWQTHVRHTLDFYMILIAVIYQVHVHDFYIHFIKCHLVVVNLSPKRAL